MVERQGQDAADVEDAHWAPVGAPARVSSWVGAPDELDDREVPAAFLPTRFERLLEAWKRAWERERDAGTAFVVAPLALAIGVMLYFTVPREPVWWATAPVVPLLLAATAKQTGGRRVACVTVLLVLLGFSLAQARVALVATPTLAGPTVGLLTGQVLWTERKAGGAVRYTVAVSHLAGGRAVDLHKARITVRQAHPSISPGDAIRVRTRLVPPSGPVTPGSYDFAFHAWFDGRGADGIAFGAPERLEGTTALGWRTRIARWRYRIGERIARSMDPRTGPLARALIIGDRSGIDDDTAESLRASGLAHILAISGLHMMLVTGLVLLSLRKGFAALSVGSQRVAVKKYAAVGALLFGTVYLLLSGMNVSTQRAYVMVCVMLAAVLFDRRALTLHNVAIAAFVVLALQPEAVFAPGFQMSFGAATALVAAYAAVLRWRRDRDTSEGVVPSTARWVGGLSFTSLVAGFATAPFAAFHFHRIAAYGLAANLLAMPVVTFLVMPLAVVSVLAMPFGMDAWTLPVLGWALELVSGIATWVAAWEGWARTGHVGTAAFTLASVAFCVVTLLRTWLRALGIVFVAAAAATFMTQAAPVVLLHEDGRNAAVVGRSPAILAGRPTSFVNKLIAEAHHPRGFSATDRASCDRTGCAARLPTGGWLAVSRDPAGLADDCRRAGILVARSKQACAAVTDAPLIVTREQLRRRGSAALYDRGPEASQGNRWQIVFAYRAEPRPWTAHRHLNGSDG